MEDMMIRRLVFSALMLGGLVYLMRRRAARKSEREAADTMTDQSTATQ
jgi:hypothetical protein